MFPNIYPAVYNRAIILYNVYSNNFLFYLAICYIIVCLTMFSSKCDADRNAGWRALETNFN